MKIKDDNYILIPGWARTQFGLRGNELMVFSLIHGFSQDGTSWFTGSINYIAEWIGASRPTIINILKNLTDLSLIIKESEIKNGVTFNRYAVNRQKISGSKESSLPVKEFNGGSKESLPNNIVNNTHINDINIIDTRDSAHTSEKSSSSLLDVDRKPKKTTRKTQQDKSKAFIEDCSKLLREFKFAGVIEEKLMEFFTMLSEIGKFLPTTSIKAQLDVLAYMDIDQQKEIITLTIARGWSSLDYAKADYDRKHHASFDTAQPGTFQPRIPGSKATEELEQKMRDSFNDPERRKKEWF